MQQILPLIPSGATKVNEKLSCVLECGHMRYFLYMIEIGFHRDDDRSSFKHKICELILSGVCRNVEVIRAFGISPTSLKRWLRDYSEKGSGVFYRERGTRGGAVLTDDVLLHAQILLDQGLTRNEVAKKLTVSCDVIRKAVKDGRLRMSQSVRESAMTRTERSAQDADCELGVGCVRTTERILASIGGIKGTGTEFGKNCDIENGGVLCALPALIENGLYRHLQERFHLPDGYYETIHIVSLLAFMVLFGVPIIERLRFEAPGEAGKLLGLDRIPEVKTLREKLGLMCADHETVSGWTRQLSQDWFDSNPELAGILYVDGHVSIYYGDETKLPRRYCSRLRLCMRGSSFYYVNDALGQPFFSVEQVVDEGLLKTLRRDIVPRLLEMVPKQPSEEHLRNDPLLHRFIVIFDREGYSPAFFKEMWQTHRIACITYHKHPGEAWPEEEFIEVEAVELDGGTQTMKLAERGTEVFSGPSRVVNPSWKALDYKVNSPRQKLNHLLSKFGKIELPSGMDGKDAGEKINEKAELLLEIEQFRFELENLTAERKKHPKHITFDELPDDLKFERLKPSKRLFFDTIKMLVYRSETAMAGIMRPLLGRDDSRVLIRQLMKSHADIIPDAENKILNVRIHGFTTKRHDQAVGNLLEILNETETQYPGTDLKLVYSLVAR